ncbi:MAG: hypothetical protein KJO64_04450, partial [Bacteroidia bacterium]|nr:hypothetical protein [Bacteroidia bacterium]
MELKIKYTSHSEIDFEKWNACIANSKSNLIFPTSYFLKAIHPRWDAIVINNYESVFPVIRAKKAGIDYAFQPYFTQQLGLFGEHEENAVALDLCLDELLKQIKYVECNLSFLNNTENYKSKCTDQISIQLNLNKPFSELQNAYSKNLT